MFGKTFEEMGIPPEYAFKLLLFSSVANTLVLQICSARDNWRPERLYFRHSQWDKYRLIGNPRDLLSQESPFVHSSKPLLAYTSIEHSFSPDEDGRERHHGNWDSLQIVSLEDGVTIRSTSQDTLRLPAGFTRGWICEIVAFGDAGLFVKAGLSKNETSFEYFIAELDATGMLKPIVELAAVFM
jgi:hypothetical protein